VAGCWERGDKPSGSGVTEIISCLFYKAFSVTKNIYRPSQMKG
jgi:hypothetical protein